MFKNFKDGKVDVFIDNVYLGTADNFVTLEFLETIYRFLSYQDRSFELYFQSEEYLFGITEICGCLYTFIDNFNDECKISQLNDIDVLSYVKNLGKEACEDISENIDSFSRFDDYLLEDNTEDSIQENKKAILDLIRAIQPYLNYREPEIGNLLFGHSYGEYSIPREEFQKEFERLLDCGFDSYGQVDDDKLDKYIKRIDGDISHIHVFDNGVFMINPYYWGDDEKLIHYPNFIYYPNNYELRCYKYFLRDSYANKELTLNEFTELINSCIESLKREGDK